MVYGWRMSRTNVDIDDAACAAVMSRYRLTTKREAINFALRTLAAEPLAAEPLGLNDARNLRGAGWEGNLEDLRGGHTT